MRGRISKVELLSRVHKLKNELYSGKYARSQEWYAGAHDSLNKILDTLAEYRE